jgi:hypothetical protein
MESIVEEIAKYMALFLGYLAIEAFKGAKEWKEKRKKEIRSDPTHLVKKKNDLENYCHVVLAESKAAHCAVWRFSNGHFYSGGDSIKNINIYTEAAITQGLEVDAISQNLPLRNFSKTFEKLQNEDAGFLVKRKGECSDFHLNALMDERGYCYMVLSVLRDPNRTMIGCLEISFVSDDVHWKNITSLQLERYRKHIEYKLA